MAVVLGRNFFDTLPQLNEVPIQEGEIAWFLYDLILDTRCHIYQLQRNRAVYTRFDESLDKISRSESGHVEEFVTHIQSLLAARLQRGEGIEH